MSGSYNITINTAPNTDGTTCSTNPQVDVSVFFYFKLNTIKNKIKFRCKTP